MSRHLHSLAMVVKIVSMTEELETPGQHTGPVKHITIEMLWKTKKVLLQMKENKKDAVQWS